ncbi:MAG: T9SS type A sorting domain-containing protein, partial [Ignavibacteriaceae bacterium]
PITPFPGTARSTIISADRLRTIEIRFGDQGKAYRYLNGYLGSNLIQPNSYRYASAITETDTVGKGVIGKLGEGFVDVPFTAWDVDKKYGDVPRQLAVGFIERRKSGNTIYFGNPDGNWDPGDSLLLSREVIIIFDAPYDPTGNQIEYTGGMFTTQSGTVTEWADPIRGFTIPSDASGITNEQRRIAASPWFNAMYVVGLQRKNSGLFYTPGDKFTVPMVRYPYTDADVFTFTTRESGKLTDQEKRDIFNKVNVYPNPLYGFNPATSYNNSPADEPFVTFSNLPEQVTIKIYSLSGTLLRTLNTQDKSNPTSPFIRWNLQNESGLRVASGLYIALISAPDYGEKVLKFSIIMPQKQLQRY